MQWLNKVFSIIRGLQKFGVVPSCKKNLAFTVTQWLTSGLKYLQFDCFSWSLLYHTVIS